MTTTRRPAGRLKIRKYRDRRSDAWTISDPSRIGVTFRHTWTAAVTAAEDRAIRDVFGDLVELDLLKDGYFVKGTDIPLASALQEIERHGDPSQAAFALAGYPRHITFFELVSFIEQIASYARDSRQRRNRHTAAITISAGRRA